MGSKAGNEFLIKDMGVSPPISRKVIELAGNLGSSFPWEEKIEFTPAEVNHAVNKLLDATPVGGFPVDFETGAPAVNAIDSAKWAMQSARQFADAFNLPIPNEINKVLKSDGLQTGISIVKSLPPNMTELWNDINTGVANMAGMTASSAFSSVDWTKGVQVVGMSINSLEDGVVSRAEAAQIGAAAGALIGSTVGSFFGPWGTAIGGAIGSLAGLLTGLLGADMAPAGLFEAARAEKAAMQRMEEAKRLMEASRRSEWSGKCEIIYAAYFEAVRACIDVIASRWTVLEYQTGWRFDLRWFDPNPGTNFMSLADKRSLTDPSFREATKSCVTKGGMQQIWTQDPDFARLQRDCPPAGTLYSSGGRTYTKDCRLGMSPHNKFIGHKECYLFCPNDFGCPYPHMGKGSYYDPVPVPNSFDLGDRAANALAARGFPYVDKNKRGASVAGKYYSQCEIWAGKPGADAGTNKSSNFTPPTSLDFLATELQRLQVVTNMIILDLNRTAAAVKTEHDMWANMLLYKAEGLNTGVLGMMGLEKSIKDGTNTDPAMQKNPLLAKELAKVQSAQKMNKFMLYGGIGALGLVAYDMMRKR